MAYAAVLPDPVLAFTRTSFPSRARGMDLAWEASHGIGGHGVGEGGGAYQPWKHAETTKRAT